MRAQELRGRFSAPRTMYSRERIECKTEDGKTLVADYYAGGEKGVILLHQRGHDRSSYAEFARRLQQEGFSAIAIDFRGHGESDGDYERFSELDYQQMLHDAVAAAKALDSRGKRVAALVGASIGANTAFRYSSLKNEVAVLLSPGLNYHGIDISAVTSRAPVLIVVAQGDEYSAASSRELYENNLFGERKLLLVGGDLHGAYLLPATGDEVLAFLREHTKDQ
ncbi:alpha/beta fold hydrolase [Candidatus Woesearchaeota archaeon]|nr:MAG: alpha/beta fold hydrolase [Candidatus Woesearchaeota archaeon]